MATSAGSSLESLATNQPVMVEQRADTRVNPAPHNSSALQHDAEAELRNHMAPTVGPMTIPVSVVRDNIQESQQHQHASPPCTRTASPATPTMFAPRQPYYVRKACPRSINGINDAVSPTHGNIQSLRPIGNNVSGRGGSVNVGTCHTTHGLRMAGPAVPTNMPIDPALVSPSDRHHVPEITVRRLFQPATTFRILPPAGPDPFVTGPFQARGPNPFAQRMGGTPTDSTPLVTMWSTAVPHNVPSPSSNRGNRNTSIGSSPLTINVMTPSSASDTTISAPRSQPRRVIRPSLNEIARERGVAMADVERSINIRGDIRGWRIVDQNSIILLGPISPTLSEARVPLRNENARSRQGVERHTLIAVGGNQMNRLALPSALNTYGTSHNAVSNIVLNNEAPELGRAPEDATMSEERAVLEYQFMRLEEEGTRDVEAEEEEDEDEDDEKGEDMV